MQIKRVQSEPGIRPFWRALSAFAVCVVLTWTLGALLQFRHLLVGLALTEVLFFALPAAVVLYLGRREEKASRAFSLPSMRETALSIALGALAVIVAVGAGWATRAAWGVPPPSAGPPWSLALALALGTALCEELLFRPVLQRGLSAVWSPGSAVVGTALLFGLVHGSLVRFPETLVLGLFGGVVFLKTGRYGACVLFQGTANLLGPLFWGVLPRWPGLFHPLSSLVVAGAAVYVAWQFSPPTNTRVWGIARHVRWALFGVSPPTGPVARAPLIAAVVYWSGVVAMVLTIVGLGLAESATLRMAQAMTNVRQQDIWSLDGEDVITAYSRVHYELWPARREAATFALPYTEARVQEARVGGVEARVRPLGAGTFELIWPATLPERPRLVEVLWTVPLKALDEPERGYRVRLQAFVPVTAYALVLRLSPNAAYEFERAPEARESEIFSILQTGPSPRNQFGTCGVGLRRRTPPESPRR